MLREAALYSELSVEQRMKVFRVSTEPRLPNLCRPLCDVSFASLPPSWPIPLMWWNALGSLMWSLECIRFFDVVFGMH